MYEYSLQIVLSSQIVLSNVQVSNWDLNIWEYNLERFELLRVQFFTTLVGYLVYIAFGTRFVFTRLAHFLF